MGRTTAAISAAVAIASGLVVTSVAKVNAATVPPLVYVFSGSPYTRNFNPFLPTSVVQEAGDVTYEPLLQWAHVTPKIYDWLATSYGWSDGGKALVFDLRHGVTWSDGKPFTSADVAYTFELLKRYPAINTNGLVFNSISTPTKYSVKLTFSTPQYINFYYIASTPIVPKHIWESVGNPAKYADPNPVGTGPYLVSSFTPSDVIYAANPHYWQKGLPKVPEFEQETVPSNTAAISAFQSGSADWTDMPLPNEKSVLAANRKYYHAWFPPEEANSLYLNLTKAPLNNLYVREAISYAIDRTLISKDAEYGEYPPCLTPTGLTLPTNASYLAAEYKNLTVLQDVARAKALLERAGYKVGAGGKMVNSKDQPLTLSILDPSAFSNYTDADVIIANELKAAGITVKLDFTSVNTWTTDFFDGNYDTSIYWGNYGPSPYYTYAGWLSSAYYQPIGKSASGGNQERFVSSAADKLLNEYASSGSSSVQKAAIVGLEKIMVNEVPVVPLFDGVAPDEYSTKDYVGWPSAGNLYALGQEGWDPEVVLTHLQPKS